MGPAWDRLIFPVVETVVLDAGPVIHLDEIGCLYLLKDFKRILLPSSVSLEIKSHRSVALQNDIRFENIDVAISESIHTTCTLFSLDSGERAAIALCSQHPASILLTDDAAARLTAKTLGIRAYGTIGVLLRAARRKQLSHDEVILKLEEIPAKSTLFIKQSLLNEIIGEARRAHDISL